MPKWVMSRGEISLEWQASLAIELLEALPPSKQHTPEDLIGFWLGHANRSITDACSKLHEDVAFRREVAEQAGIGFEFPAEKLEVAPNCTQSELLSNFGVRN